MIPPKEKLLYHWDGGDDLVDGKWYDKVQGLPWTKAKTKAPKISNGKGYKTGSSGLSGGFVMDINTQEARNGTIGLNMGRCWRIVVDCEPTVLGDAATTRSLIADFCETRDSRTGFSFGFNREATALRNGFEVNREDYSIVPFGEGNWFGKRITYEYGCRLRQGRYYQYIKITDGNGTIETEASNSHPRFVFDKNYWNFNNIAYLGLSYAASGSFGQLILYDVKIYGTQDYE